MPAPIPTIRRRSTTVTSSPTTSTCGCCWSTASAGTRAARGSARLNYRASPARLLIEELWAAAKNHHLDRVKLLVAQGVDVNAAGLRDGRTPYEEALLAGHEDVAAWLLAHGAKRIDLDPADAFALDCIKGRGEEARARLRLDPGLLTRRGDAGLIELLHRAEEAGSRDGIRLLLDLGADINGMVPQTAYDRTVLHNAAGWRGLPMVEFLLSLGADPQRRCLPFHSTPIGWAYHNKQDARRRPTDDGREHLRCRPL